MYPYFFSYILFTHNLLLNFISKEITYKISKTDIIWYFKYLVKINVSIQSHVIILLSEDDCGPN